MNLLNPRVLIGGAVLALLAVGFALLQVLRDVVMVLLILVILGLAAALIVMWLRQRKAKQATEEIETTLTQQADREIERSSPGQAADLENLKAELVAAIKALKGARAGQGALSTVPWYLLLGPARSGKGALVQHSGLTFPLTDDEHHRPRAVRGVGGTRTLEWWLSEQAVLLEMPGRLLATAEFEDQGDWIEFLGVLKKHRPHRPINGVLLPVAIDQVAGQPDSEIEKLGRRLRERVQELIQHLGVAFPVYLVFTGCDHIAGFSEFFADLDAQRRAQPWGATIPVSEARTRPAEELFDAEHRGLVQALSSRWLRRAPTLPEGEPRSRVFAFPLQLERLAPSLSRLVRTLFDAGGPGERPLFRGFYFTSAAPSGAAVDRVLGDAAASVGATPGAAAAPASATGTGWFVNELFTKVIFPDRDSATEATSAIERRRLSRLVWASSLGLVLLAMTVLFSAISCSNGGHVDRTMKAAEFAKRVAVSGAFEERVFALDSLRSQIARLEALRAQTPWWRHLGGYWGNDLIEPALRLHAEGTLLNLVKPALPRIAGTLEREIAGPTRFVNAYYTYWAYRLLMKPADISAGDAPVIGHAVRRAMAPEIQGVTLDRRRAVAYRVHENVRFLAAHENLVARSRDLYVIPEAGDLTARAGNWLRARWDAAQFYDLLASTTRTGTQPLDLEALTGRTDLLASSAEVPGPWTQAGWRSSVAPRLAWMRDRMQDPWVVEEFQALARDLPGELERRYADQYVREWSAFLASVTARRAPTWQTAAGALETIGKPDSPLFELIEGAARETRFGADSAAATARVEREFEALQGLASGSAGKKKPGFFARLFRKKPKEGELFQAGDPDGEKYRKLVVNLKEKVEPLAQGAATSQDYDRVFLSNAESASPIAAFTSFARDLIHRYPGGGTAAALEVVWLPLRLMPRDVPGPPRPGAAPPVAATPAPGPPPPAGAGRMPPDVNDAWRATVLEPFQATLQGKYPVAGGADASLASFSDFFRPGGIFWRFYGASLSKYVSEEGTALPGAEGLVSPELAEAVRKARDIRDALFAGGSASPQLRFRVRPGPPDAEQKTTTTFYWSELDVEGQSLHYAPGVPQWAGPWTWPGPQPTAGSSVSANAGGSPTEQHADGPWSLFRLLDRGQLRSAETTAEVRFRMSAGGVTWSVPFELEPQAESGRHPFRKNFLRFTLPAEI